MGEALRPSAMQRDWRIHCYDASGVVRVCTVDSDHGAVRIGITSGERQEFFELRVEQVNKFWAGLVSTLGMIRSGGPDGTTHWRGQCHTQWGELSGCVIEVREQDAIRIAWVTMVAGVVTVLPGARECSLELRGDQIGVFQAALTAAMKICDTDIAIHGKHWADDETDETGVVSPPGMTETEFVNLIYEMAIADAPKRFAIVGEIGDRVDAIELAWGIKLSDHHIEVVSAGSDHVRTSFSSLEHVWRVLSLNGKIKIRIVPLDEPQRQVKAA
jgi:hypothetical protein